jgi:hypothetical protein
MLIRLHEKEFKVSPGNNGAFWQEVAKGTWESDTFAIFDRFLGRQHSCLDIGAWIGPTLCRKLADSTGSEP